MESNVSIFLEVAWERNNDFVREMSEHPGMVGKAYNPGLESRGRKIRSFHLYVKFGASLGHT